MIVLRFKVDKTAFRLRKSFGVIVAKKTNVELILQHIAINIIDQQYDEFVPEFFSNLVIIKNEDYPSNSLLVGMPEKFRYEFIIWYAVYQLLRTSSKGMIMR